MPKPRSRIASGLSVSEIMNMPISKLTSYTPSQQREIVSRVASAGNKRLRNLEKQNISNPAIRKLNESGGKLSVRGKTGDDLIREFNRARDFMKNRFSSAKEWKKTVKKLSQSEQLQNIPEHEIGEVFDYYDNARETDPNVINELNKYELMDYIDGLIQIEGLTDPDEINRRVLQYAQSEHDRRQRENEQLNRRFSSGLEYEVPERLQKKRKPRKRK